MKVSLIYPLLSRTRSLIDENKQYWPPLGLAYIAALLRKKNHQVKIIDRDMLTPLFLIFGSLGLIKTFGQLDNFKRR